MSEQEKLQLLFSLCRKEDATTTTKNQPPTTNYSQCETQTHEDSDSLRESDEK